MSLDRKNWLTNSLMVAKLEIKMKMQTSVLFTSGCLSFCSPVSDPDKPEEEAEKILRKMRKLRRRSMGVKYHLGFAFCELLNLCMVLICFYLVNGLISTKNSKDTKDTTERNFIYYAINVKTFYENQQSDNKTVRESLNNPMCMNFPTFINCEIHTGSIEGGVEPKSYLCVLPNNLWNQYYFLVLWIWWVFLITASMLGLVYRLAGIMVVSFSREVLNLYLTPMGMVAGKGLQIDPNRKEKILASDYFVLSRVVPNVKRSLLEELLKKMKPKRERTDETDNLITQTHIDMDAE